jgi:hypothetical protein
MARREKVTVDPQPELVPMSEDELKGAGRQLAVLEGELDEMEASHKKEAADRAKQRKTVRGKIKSLASQIRKQGR